MSESFHSRSIPGDERSGDQKLQIEKLNEYDISFRSLLEYRTDSVSLHTPQVGN